MSNKNPFLFNCHDLPRRAGEMREYELTIDEHEPLGVPLVMIPNDGEIYIDLRIEAVDQGVLASGTASGEALGECTRCLDPVSFFVEEEFQELFYYEADTRHKPKSGQKPAHRGEEIVVEGGEEEEIRMMQGDLIDLEGVIRDALILNLPINPLCDIECLGLCPDCGLKWADLPEDHAHQSADIRWAGLSDWKGPNS